jgi:Protein of unknown function (DUF2934)
MTQKRTSENDLIATGNAAAARRKAARPRTKHSTAPAEGPVVSASPVPETAEPVAILSEPALPVPGVEAVVISMQPVRDEVARLAYSYWEARGCQGGSAEEDWLRAEMEIRSAATVTA